MHRGEGILFIYNTSMEGTTSHGNASKNQRCGITCVSGCLSAFFSRSCLGTFSLKTICQYSWIIREQIWASSTPSLARNVDQDYRTKIDITPLDQHTRANTLSHRSSHMHAWLIVVLVPKQYGPSPPSETSLDIHMGSHNKAQGMAQRNVHAWAQYKQQQECKITFASKMVTK